jgi:hypothetical protein
MIRHSILIALVAFAAPLHAEPKLENVRLTYGDPGPTRPSAKVLPGDELTVAFVMTGLAKDDDGKVNLSLMGELFDAQGKSLIKTPARTANTLLTLGGTELPGSLIFDLPADFPAGKYVVRGLVKDLLAGKEARAEQGVEVLPPKLGIARLYLPGDAQGQSSSGGNLTVGQVLYVRCQGVGFARKEKQIHLVGSMRVLDESGKSLFPNALSFSLAQEAPEEVNHVSFRFSASTNRAGRFTVQIEVEDKIAGKSVTEELPLVVHAPAATTGK